MRRHIESCKQSGLTVSEYCIQKGILKSNYYYWIKKLGSENKSGSFTAVKVTTNAAIEITYPNGVQLSFTGNINVATIKELVCCI
mgnify:FL=1